MASVKAEYKGLLSESYGESDIKQATFFYFFFRK